MAKNGKSESYTITQKKDVIADVILSVCIIIPLSFAFMQYDVISWIDHAIHSENGFFINFIFYIFLATLVAGSVLAIRHTARLNTVIRKLEDVESTLRYEGQRKTEREKLASLGELAGGLAHEINNALVPSIGMSEIVKKRLEKTDPELAQYVNVIYESSLHGRKIVQNVLAFARGQDADHEIVDAAEVIHEGLALCAPLLPGTVALTTAGLEEVADSGACIYVNRTGIGQILTNLLKNASDAMPGGGEISVRAERRMVGADFAVENDLAECEHLILHVKDTGTGMEDHVKRQIFNPFFTTKAVDKGTGLGLSTVYGIMRKLGGSITVDSAPGAGSTFSLYFPITDPALFSPFREKEARYG